MDWSEFIEAISREGCCEQGNSVAGLERDKLIEGGYWLHLEGGLGDRA